MGHSHDVDHPSWTGIRGKRTTTKSKLKNLPQGGLEPLPDHSSDQTPEKAYPRVLQQHLNNMRKFPECVILTRVGDFYELYFEQVGQYAPLVNLKQAKRKTSLGDVPMAGFQHGQLNRYIKMFVKDHGKQVAISEQVFMTSDEAGSGLKFDRKVTRIVSAGTLIDEDFLDPNESNYLLAVHVDGPVPQYPDREDAQIYMRNTKVGLSWVDLSSGEFYTQGGNLASLPSFIAGIRPSEVVLDSALNAKPGTLQRLLGDGGHAIHFHDAPHVSQADLSADRWTPMLERAVSDREKATFSYQEMRAVNTVLEFVRAKLIDSSIKLQPPICKTDDEYMSIDRQSIRGLEIRSTLREDRFEGSLLHAVRRTVTKSGARLLSRRIAAPSLSLTTINARLDLVQQMVQGEALREDALALLRRTTDVRRLLQRFSIDKGDADDLLGLANTINIMDEMASIIHQHISDRQEAEEAGDSTSMGCLWDLLARLDLEEPSSVAKAVLEAIDEEGLNQQHSAEDEQRAQMEDMAAEVESADAAGELPPKLGRRSSSNAAPSKETDSEEIWIMRRSASRTLQIAHNDLERLMERKQSLLTDLRRQLKAESLTFKWSAQLGHHCHVKSKSGGPQIDQLPGARPVASTKSTRTFYLAQWTELGVTIDDAKLRIRKEEERVFNTLRAKVMANLMRLRRNASVLDELDVACSSATVAKERGLVRPDVNSSAVHHIVGGRHPTVDLGLTTSGRQFTSNDCAVGSPDANVYLITGPNMGGKSTYLRQNALITILAQTGCYVPAEHASIGIVDKIFSRVGSADNLYQDQSTFMVEMLETAEILKGATERSFVIMDEVGRGTTPEDGIAVSYAALHHLHNVNKCRTLFATHFHDLADMTRDFEGLQCWCTDIEEGAGGKREGGDEWSYMHKLRRGVNRRSHALKVAKMAGMPQEAVDVAGQVLESLQRQRQGEERDQDAAYRVSAAG